MLQLDFGSSDATVAAVVPQITQLVDQAVRPVAWDTDQRLIAMWLHGKSINTQRVYRSAAAAWFLEVVGKPLGAVTLGGRQTFSDTPYRKSELSTPDQNPKHSLQIDRRPTAFAWRITGSNDLAQLLPRQNAIHVLEKLRSSRRLRQAVEVGTRK